ncbi:MAG: STAS domain-containing protein [Phycisphaerae bacterium]
MDIETRREGQCRVVSIRGSADINASASLREALLGAVEGGDTCIVCDLSEADFICSDALGVLITAYLKARGRGGFLHLAGPHDHLTEILETTRLNRLFRIYPDVGCALATQSD